MTTKLDSELVEHLCYSGKAVPGAHSTTAVTLDHCHSCQLPLPWPLPVAGQWASPVACPQCHRWYFTETRNHSTPELTIPIESRESSTDVQSWNQSQPSVSAKVASIIAKLFGECFVHEERRGFIRYALSLPIVAVPLNEKGLPVAEAFGLSILNFSAGGCLLLADNQVENPLLLLDFSSADCLGIQLLARILRQETCDTGIKVGCEFLHSPDESLPFRG